MFKLSFSSNAFTKYSLVEAMNYICYMGYDGIEILGDHPHISDGLEEKDYSMLKKELEDRKLAVANINTNDCKEFLYYYKEEPFFTARREVFELKLRQFQRNIKVAEKLGCNHISISSGPLKKDESRNKLIDTFFYNLNTALEYLPDGINLGIELEPGHIIQCLNDYSIIFNTFKKKNLGINLDVGHLYCAGNTIEEAFEKYSDKIFHIHLEDIKDLQHFHLILGDGNLPLKGILSFLQKHYNGYISIELYPYKENPVKACFASKLYLIFNS